MARIKINDLPKDMKIRKEEMKKVSGGGIAGSILDGASLLTAPLIWPLEAAYAAGDAISDMSSSGDGTSSSEGGQSEKPRTDHYESPTG